jgi:hypothetical protein
MSPDRQPLETSAAIHRVQHVAQAWSRDPHKFAAAFEMAPTVPYEKLMTIVAAAALRAAWNESLHDPRLADLSDDQVAAAVCVELLAMTDVEWAEWLSKSRDAIEELNRNWETL